MPVPRGFGGSRRGQLPLQTTSSNGNNYTNKPHRTSEGNLSQPLRASHVVQLADLPLVGLLFVLNQGLFQELLVLQLVAQLFVDQAHLLKYEALLLRGIAQSLVVL